MSFGKNPHVAKAQAAEQKARDAKDDAARARAWRDAGRLWDRAAERENHDKRRQDYTRNAEAARAQADGNGEPLDELATDDRAEPLPAAADRAPADEEPARSSDDEPKPTRWLN